MRNSLKSQMILCLLAASVLSLSTFAQKRAALFAPDKGKFTIQLDGQTVGHEEFEIAPSIRRLAAHGTTDLKTADAPATRVTGTTHLAARWRAHQLRMELASGKNQWRQDPFRKWSREITLQMQGARPLSRI